MSVLLFYMNSKIMLLFISIFGILGCSKLIKESKSLFDGGGGGGGGVLGQFIFLSSI